MLTGIAVLLLVLVALLAIPVTVTFQVSWQKAIQGRVSLHWAFGLVRIQIPSMQSKPPSVAGEAPTKKVGRGKRLAPKRTNLSAVVRQKAFRRRLFRFMCDVWHAVHKTDVNLRVRVGLGDPADTGKLWSVVGPVAGILSNIREATVEIEPEFIDATFELESRGSIRFIPLQLIYLAGALLLSPSLWQGIKRMRKAE